MSRRKVDDHPQRTTDPPSPAGTSFLDLPGARKPRKPTAAHSTSLPATRGELGLPGDPGTRAGKLRKKTSRLFGLKEARGKAGGPEGEAGGGLARNRSSVSSESMGGAPSLSRSTASAPEVALGGDSNSVDSRTTESTVIVDSVPPTQPFGARMSSWFSHLLVVGAEGTQDGRRSIYSSRRRSQLGEERGSVQSAGTTTTAQTFFAVARQKAAGGVRYLLDGDAMPDSTEDVWVRGVVHRFEARPDEVSWPASFLLDFRSTVWCTYRSQYAPILALAEGTLPSPEAYKGQHLPRIPSDTEAQEPAGKPSPWAWMSNVASGVANQGIGIGTVERGLTADSGWGCMLRTGQSLLANALVHHHLGRDWRLPDVLLERGSEITTSQDRARYATYIQILSWFMDDPSPTCPFSVHRMALVGKQLGKGVGEWFGPSTAAGAVKTLTNGFPVCGLSIVTATDSTIYASEVVAASHADVGGWADLMDTLPLRAERGTAAGWGGNGVLILAGVRLGMQGVNPLYHDSIKALFTFPQSVGIAGGRPSSSYYFIGTQGDNLFYLDPHFTRPAIPLKTPVGERNQDDPSRTDDVNEAGEAGQVDWLLAAYSPDQLKTFHCEKVKKMAIGSLDPSMLMGFLCRDYEDWLDLRERLNSLPQRIISIENTVPTWGDDSDDPDIESFTETDVDDESSLSRQLSASTFAYEGADRSHAGQRTPGDDTEAFEDVFDVPSRSAGSAGLGLATDQAQQGSPPLTPTVVTTNFASRHAPLPLSTENDPGADVSDPEDSFDSVDVPLPTHVSGNLRHRSRSSGDRTIVRDGEGRSGFARER